MIILYSCMRIIPSVSSQWYLSLLCNISFKFRKMSQVFSYQRILNENGIVATALDGVFDIPDHMSFLKELQRKSALDQDNAKESPAITLFKNCYWCGADRHKN